ncbi:UDP-N-acetylhexosamine pyrophosphorylase [Lepeophtheirus salmonis]|uniref:UDP-N-acetylhexosamine pyrophosphorylase n=1 Tax=Lepeophtheirus salmonis TaxID=72036 RepID=UPI001AE2DAE3|nr:UDP-N-acetylhexosamine pyrophosphorylase-like [Lepeophtheirus salmonis]
MDTSELRNTLKKYGQEHLLHHWDSINDKERSQLIQSLSGMNWESITKSFERSISSMDEGGKMDDRMTPLSPDQCASLKDTSDILKEEYKCTAYKAMKEGQLAILLVAGGQGTRLGVSYPKGMYSVGLESNKSLFQLQAERILKLEQLSEGKIPLYVMGSHNNLETTRNFFTEHSFFGLNPDRVVFFSQGTYPCFSLDGKVLLSSKFEVARASNGNGGLYEALRDCKIIEDMESRKVKYIQLYCVDNILVRVGDPFFTGYCIKEGAECANKVVAKSYPSETVGITCKVDGAYQVVEYSEITDKAAEQRNPDGSLTYGLANLCIHFFSLAFLSKVSNELDGELEFHVAKKKIPFVNEEGVLIKPEKPNGVKLEKFVFDVFRFAKDFVIWECIREDEFAPLKNAPGASSFSPEHCKMALYALNQKMILEAGGVLVDLEDNPVPKMQSPAAPLNCNGSSDTKNDTCVQIEISPLVSYSGEGLEELVKGRRITVPVYINDKDF